MKLGISQDMDNFCSGHIIVSSERKIISCNHYICDLTGESKDNIDNSSISTYFTKASNIFLDSYVYPILLNSSEIQECHMSWVGKKGEIIPVVVNIKLGEDGRSFWSIYTCVNRDKLYTELIKAKDQLEVQSKELFQLATTDPLTGLLNRRELGNQVRRLMKQLARGRSTVALLAIDVDHFKRVNDQYGHQTGDKVLKRLAEILFKDRRANDLAARTGGEEFFLVLSDVDKNNAFAIAEQLRENIATQSINDIKITVSIGLVVSPVDSNTDFDFLMKLADKAMYQSKNTGRNKTTIAKYL